MDMVVHIVLRVDSGVFVRSIGSRMGNANMVCSIDRSMEVSVGV